MFEKMNPLSLPAGRGVGGLGVGVGGKVTLGPYYYPKVTFRQEVNHAQIWAYLLQRHTIGSKKI